MRDMTEGEPEKSKEQTKLEHMKKPLVDKDTAFHFLFGCGLGMVLGLSINIFVLALILGIILIPVLEYTVHRIATGYATLTTRNAVVDLCIAGLGLILVLIIVWIFYY